MPIQPDNLNIAFSLAADLVNYTSRHIFLTGKAGTGKTTFLKYIRENPRKQMAVVAPTGVAAINAGGVTIHSFFQLPFSPFIPDGTGFSGAVEDANNKHSLLGRLRLTSERKLVLKELELLVIDEISMVRCDVLDAIDLVLRHIRSRYNETFGGVQVLFIGDLYQLPPVAREQEWSLLRTYYESPYFFSSRVIKDQPPVYIEFTKIYRQSEEHFIRLLNKVRNNDMDESSLAALHQRYQPDFFDQHTEGFVLLTTHNEKARAINARAMEGLKENTFRYLAEIEGEFPAASFPCDEMLELKVGAQVMFIKNDTDKSRRYYNGKIGIVTKLEEYTIFVQCKDAEEAIEVAKEKWENIRYTLDNKTRNVSEDVLGSFSQYPLRLAWAITIHKSQGLTFDKAIIDAAKAFAPGQVYVALSRCTSLDGLVLHSRIQPQTLLADARIVQFNKNISPLPVLQSELAQGKKDYQEKILLSIFDFSKTLTAMKELRGYLLQHRTSFNEEVAGWSEELLVKLELLQETAGKFQRQIKSLLAIPGQPENNPELQQRLRKASIWFGSEVKSAIEAIQRSPARTDSKLHAKEYNEILKELFLVLSQQLYLLGIVGDSFSVEAYLVRKKMFQAPFFSVNAYAAASENKIELAHSLLFTQLKKLRDSLCSKKNLPIYLVAGSKTLEEMATYLPQTVEELEQISGFGTAKAAKYGAEFLRVITAYASERGLSSAIKEIKEKPGKAIRNKQRPSKEKRQQTKTETFRLFNEGKSVAEIASERNLTVQTIEGHLAHFVSTGDIKIDALVSREKIVLIEPALKELENGSLNALKQMLPSEIGFGEIKFVLAHLDYQKSSSHIDH